MSIHPQLRPELVKQIEQLVDASFAGRDDLYAAAESLDDDVRSNICRRLAEYLAKHATELQQLLLAHGEQAADPLDIHGIAEAYFGIVRTCGGEAAVLDAAESCEQKVKAQFDNVLQEIAGEYAASILERQRSQVELGATILRSMKTSPSRRRTTAAPDYFLRMTHTA